MALIILEGPDGSGKSSLAKELEEKHNAVVIHHGPYPNETDIFHHYLASLGVAQLCRDQGRIVAFDRCWTSEGVYGPAVRGGENRIGAEQQRMLDRVALSLDAAFVLCLPPLKVVKANVQRRIWVEYVQREPQIEDVWQRYAKGRYATGISRVLTWDYTKDMLVSDVAEQAITVTGITHNDGPGVGHFRPGVTLFVGEQCNVKQDGERWPFVSHLGCSPWFAGELIKTGITEAECYFANALDPSGNKTDLSFIERLQPRRIVALGKVAQYALRDAGHERDVVHIDHPQYWKRFHYSDPWVALREAIYGGKT